MCEIFTEKTEDKYSYKQVSIVILVLSVVFGSLGLANILDLLGPILDGIYPAAIVLVVFFALSPQIKSEKYLKACKYAMYQAMIFGMIDAIWKYLVKANINPIGLVSLYEKSHLPKTLFYGFLGGIVLYNSFVKIQRKDLTIEYYYKKNYNHLSLAKKGDFFIKIMVITREKG